jgi:hypothetical protein
MKRDRTDVPKVDRKAVKEIANAKAIKVRATRPLQPEKIRYARAKFDAVVLVCAKCAKRQGLPKGTLRSVLKRAMKERAGSSKERRAKPRLVEVGCLGPCPKRAVAVATTASLARGRIALVDPAGDRQAILDALLPEFGPKAPLTPPGAPEAPTPGPCTS